MGSVSISEEEVMGVMVEGLTPLKSSQRWTLRSALAARTIATVWMEILLPKPVPLP